MKNKIKYIVIPISVAIVFYAAYRFFVSLVVKSALENKYTLTEAIDNYNRREKEITDLVRYFISHVPPDKAVTFNLVEDDDRFGIGVALPDGVVDPARPNFGDDNLKLHSGKADSILARLNWSAEIAMDLKQKLKNSGCINIMSGDPVRIDYRYSGNGLHSYMIFSKPLADSTIKFYNTKFGDTVLKKSVVVLYTTGL